MSFGRGGSDRRASELFRDSSERERILRLLVMSSSSKDISVYAHPPTPSRSSGCVPLDAKDSAHLLSLQEDKLARIFACLI